jgi:hypothetical protein
MKDAARRASRSSAIARLRRAPGAALAAVALAVPRPAAAQPVPEVLVPAGPAAQTGMIEVTVTPKGAPWSVGGHGGFECEPTCTLRLLPESYLVTVGEVKDTFLLQVPTDIVYDPGNPRLRTIGGWTAVGGAALGGVFLGLGAWGLLNACVGTGKCPNGLQASRPVAEGLVIGSAALISISVTGAILFAISGQSIRLHELAPVPEPPRRKHVDVVLRGPSVEIVGRF